MADNMTDEQMLHFIRLYVGGDFTDRTLIPVGGVRLLMRRAATAVIEPLSQTLQDVLDAREVEIEAARREQMDADLRALAVTCQCRCYERIRAAFASTREAGNEDA